MQVTIRRRVYIPENYQQRPGNRKLEIVAMHGDEVLDGTEGPLKMRKYMEKFMREMCAERGWEVVQ
jgi:hypothetical protein